MPVLIRFQDIIRHRVVALNEAFRKSIAEFGYRGCYQGVYPIKVNQQGHVVESIVAADNIGLEAGSKPELLAVSAMATNDTPIICNGFKDYEFIEMAMLAQKMGRQIIPVVEKYTELELVLEYAEKVGVRPNIGMRVKVRMHPGDEKQPPYPVFFPLLPEEGIPHHPGSSSHPSSVRRGA